MPAHYQLWHCLPRPRRGPLGKRGKAWGTGATPPATLPPAALTLQALHPGSGPRSGTRDPQGEGRGGACSACSSDQVRGDQLQASAVAAKVNLHFPNPELQAASPPFTYFHAV